MTPIRSIIWAGMLAMPLLLLAQCGPESSPPSPLTSLQKAPCLDNADPARTFEIVSPRAGVLCTGQCGRILLDVQNACGDWTASVEGWYDGVYQQVGSATMVPWVHWDTPLGPHALAPARREVRLRVTLVDSQGLIGTREVVLSPVITLNLTPQPAPRPPVERD